MFKSITSLLTKPRTLNAELELDHVESCQDQLILGLKLSWTNGTRESLEIGEVMVHLFPHGKHQAAVPLIYNGRFVRIPFQKSVTKIAGATSFHLASGATLVENIRFLTRDIRDLTNGTYSVELHTTVAEGTYVHNFDLKIAPELRQGTSGTEHDAGALTAPSSTAFTRALRIGLNPNVAK